MLRLELDKQARTSEGKALRSIVEDDVGAFGGNRVVGMVAPSGSGKAATVIVLATKHFVVCCVCSTLRATASLDFNDSSFITLATASDVENMHIAVVDEERGDPFGIDFRVKKQVPRERVELEFLAHLLSLQLLLDHNPGLEVRQFFLEQNDFWRRPRPSVRWSTSCESTTISQSKKCSTRLKPSFGTLLFPNDLDE